MRSFLVVVLTVTAVAAQQSQMPEPQSFSRPAPKVTTASPGLHLSISNPSVRVFSIELPAHGSAAIGREVRDYMLLAVSGGTAEITGPGNTFPVELKSGEIEIFKGGWPHQLLSKSDEPSSWLIVELARELHPERASCGLAGPSCGQFRFGKSEQGEYNESVLFETPSARVLRAELAPASTLPTHADRLDHVVIPMMPCEIALNGESTRRRPGESIWVHGGFPELRNTGKESTRLVILEIK
jgi:hypothetical protein